MNILYEINELNKIYNEYLEHEHITKEYKEIYEEERNRLTKLLINYINETGDLSVLNDIDYKHINNINDWDTKYADHSYIDVYWSHDSYVGILISNYTNMYSTPYCFKNEKECWNFMRLLYPYCPTKKEFEKKCKNL